MNEPSRDIPSELHAAFHNDATVHCLVLEGATLRDIINQLVEDKKLYLKRIVELEAIAPRKIKLPDGKVMIWHCPNNLLPEEKL